MALLENGFCHIFKRPEQKHEPKNSDPSLEFQSHHNRNVGNHPFLRTHLDPEGDMLSWIYFPAAPFGPGNVNSGLQQLWLKDPADP